MVWNNGWLNMGTAVERQRQVHRKLRYFHSKQCVFCIIRLSFGCVHECRVLHLSAHSMLSRIHKGFSSKLGYCSMRMANNNKVWSKPLPKCALTVRQPYIVYAMHTCLHCRIYTNLSSNTIFQVPYETKCFLFRYRVLVFSTRNGRQWAIDCGGGGGGE